MVRVLIGALAVTCRRMQKVRLWSVLGLCFGILLAHQDALAQLDRWRAHTSLREITALDASDTHVWAGTTGGVFSYALEGGETRRYSFMDGLSGLQVTALAFDPSCATAGCVWIGYGNGVLDRLDVESLTVSAFRDLERASHYVSRRINGLRIHGDSLLIAADFGLVVFDKVAGEVADTYDQFGSLDPATAAYDAVVAPASDGATHLWVGTARGVVHAPLGAANLQDPAVWTAEAAGLPSPEVRSIAHFDGSIYAGTRGGLAMRSSQGLYTKLPNVDDVVPKLVATQDRLIGIDRYDPFVVSPGGVLNRVFLQDLDGLTTFATRNGNEIWLGQAQFGLIPARIDAGPAPGITVLRDCSEGEAACYPPGPYHNQFAQLDVDPSGNLWAAGVMLSDGGFYKLDRGGEWTDYIWRQVPELDGRSSFNRIHAAPDGNVWAASEGNALAHVSKEGEVAIYAQHNSPLRAEAGLANQNYIVVNGLGTDPEGRLWATVRASSRPLVIRDPDGSWASLPFPASCGGFTPLTATFRDLFVDQYGQKWLTLLSRNNFQRKEGLMVLDTRNTPDDPSDDYCRVFHNEPGRGEGLPSDSVNAVVEDLDGNVWVATDQGIAYTLNTGIVAADPGATFSWPLIADRSLGTYILQGLKVNGLSVDPSNRIWAATNDGLWLMEKREEGYDQLAHFTTENSPLPSNDVRDVEVNPFTGEVFVSTAEGMVSYQGEARAASAEVADLLVYPNPVRLQDDVQPEIHIQNLVDATEIMIMTPDGTVVNRFSARGGQKVWDARDQQGRAVPSGVYLIVAVGKDGEGAAYGKVAIIR